MMHTAYTCSNSIISIRTYSAFNNDCFYYSNDRCPSNYCSCCCSFPINSCKLILPTNPSYLYGLRQSTLIQCPPSRRFVLGSSDRVFGRLSNYYDVGCCCCLESRCVKQQRIDRIMRSDCNCKGKCCVSKEKGIDVNKIKSRVSRPKRDFRSNALGDVEAMLSLLSEGNVEDCGVVREKRRSSFKDGNVGSKQDVGIKKLKDRKPNVGSIYRESEPKNRQLDLGRVPRPRIREEKGEDFSKDEDQRLGRRESSSSYHSLSDFGGYESDQEVEVRQEQSVGESSSSHIKDSRKSGGVIINEGTEKDWVKRRDEKEQVLQSDTRDDLRVSGSIQRDWRKKSEKKLTDESEETKSRNESVAKKSQLYQTHESSSTTASSSKNQFNYQNEQSTSDTKSLGQSNFQIIEDNRARRYSKTSNQHEHSMQINREDVETTSSAWRRSSQGVDSNIVDKSIQKTGCDYCETCGRSMEENKTQSDVQRHADRSETSIDAKLAISGESLSESSRHRKHDRSSSSLQTSVDEESRQHDQIHIVTGQASTKRKSQHYRRSIDSSTQSTSRGTQQSKAGMHNLVDKSRSNTESQPGSSCRNEESSLSFQTSGMGENKKHDKIYLRTSQAFDARSKTQIHSEVQGPSTGNFSGTATISKPSVPSVSHSEVQQFSGEAVQSGQLSVTSPPYQHASRLPQFPEASSDPVRKDMGRTTKVGSDSMQKFYLASSPSSYGEGVDSGSKFGEKYFPEDALVSAARMQDSSSVFVGEFVEKISNEASASETSIEQKLSNLDSKSHPMKGSTQSGSEDALASAAYMQESSSQIVGEFVEKMSHEASASETSIEKKLTKVNLKHQDKNNMLKGSTQSGSDKIGLQEHDVEHSSGVYSPNSEKKESYELDSSSSGDSGTKGSADQMWDVKDHFVQEATEVEPLEGATTESVNSKRTGKSLWNVVSGVLRLRWGSHTQKKKSPVKGQSSPSRSASGETWFSDNEAGTTNDDGMEAVKISLVQETSSDQPHLETTRSQKKDVAVMSLDEQSSHVDMGASSSSIVLHSSSLSGDAIEGKNANLNIAQHMSKPSPSVGLSTPGKLRRSLAFDEDDGAEKIEAPTSSSDEKREISVDVGQTSASASKETEVDLKKKKLQRSKVVLQRFEDWEDAYRRDREQRKVDEIFMREALSEAIKAADSWEVPVGAVLVHNGNIIARGYNLVEELRDSTAHAEMLCIKEGSNVLRTWRLSETTLYVTLEPCPMCAGAIMQARISTLVWGAPNKLLGADGSWIRLFPEGMEGEPRAEVTDKPAAPAHPFHPNMKIRRGILEEECAEIMQQFFQLRRRKVKEKKAETSSEESESVQPTCFPKPHHRSKLLHKMHNVIHRSKQSSD